MTDMIPPVGAQGEGCHCHGRGRRARPRGFCCSPAIVHGFSYPRAPRKTGRPGPARSPWTRFHLPGHAVREGACGEITNCTTHHRTSAIGEWYGIMLRMELEALHREPREDQQALTHSLQPSYYYQVTSCQCGICSRHVTNTRNSLLHSGIPINCHLKSS